MLCTCARCYLASVSKTRITQSPAPLCRAQLLGFVMVSVLFWVSAGKYNWLIEKNNIGVFQFIYFFSSFWGQFGPNCTTFLLAGAHHDAPSAAACSGSRPRVHSPASPASICTQQAANCGACSPIITWLPSSRRHLLTAVDAPQSELHLFAIGWLLW